MGLLASCLLLLLAPQAPNPPSPSATPTTIDVALSQDPVDLTALRDAEADDKKTDATAMVRLANGADAAIAARAAWLLGRGAQPERLPALQLVATDSPHAEARLQALQTLLKLREVGSTSTAIRALDDRDRRVRTLAAQLLGALNRPTAREPLLALLQARKSSEPGPATDVQAALVALHDLGAHDLLLRAATAVHDGNAEGTGEALAFCLQQLAPKLEREQQNMLALGMLDHREPLVRRFAITAIAELGDPSTANALEGRLANESAELRPLIEVALAHVRQDAADNPEQGAALEMLRNFDQQAKAWWKERSPVEQGAVAIVPLVLFGLLMLVLWRRRQVQGEAAAIADAEATAALVQPSEDFENAEQFTTDSATDPLAAWAEQPEHDGAEVLATDADAEFADAEPAAEEALAGEATSEAPADDSLATEAGFDATETELEVVGDESATEWQDDAQAQR